MTDLTQQTHLKAILKATSNERKQEIHLQCFTIYWLSEEESWQRIGQEDISDETRITRQTTKRKKKNWKDLQHQDNWGDNIKKTGEITSRQLGEITSRQLGR